MKLALQVNVYMVELSGMRIISKLCVYILGLTRTHEHALFCKICHRNFYLPLDIEPQQTEQRNLPLVTSRKLQFPSKVAPKQAWLETLEQTEDDIIGIVDLHPEIFGLFPR